MSPEARRRLDSAKLVVWLVIGFLLGAFWWLVLVLVARMLGW